MNISEEIAQRASDIENRIRCFLPEQYEYQKTIVDAMSYSVLAGGKRLRPMLMEASYQMFGGEEEDIDAFMAAIEMIHTYSLVHDDLPAMDNDEYRRGKKTTHAVYGEAMGILAGDALLNYAYETAAQALPALDKNPNVGAAFLVLAQKAGVYGMVGGQVVDVEADKRGETTIAREKLDFIYQLKTGALIEAAMKIGAILAGATTEEQRIVEQAAGRIGLAFQIQDDILDVTSTFEELGKPIGSDEKNQKSTYVTYEGLEKSAADVEALSGEASALLATLGKDDAFLQELIHFLVHRNK